MFLNTMYLSALSWLSLRNGQSETLSRVAIFHELKISKCVNNEHSMTFKKSSEGLPPIHRPAFGVCLSLWVWNNKWMVPTLFDQRIHFNGLQLQTKFHLPINITQSWVSDDGISRIRNELRYHLYRKSGIDVLCQQYSMKRPSMHIIYLTNDVTRTNSVAISINC